MESTVRDVLNFIKENDVKFIRLAFCDLWGNLKNISIMPNQIEKVFKEGIAIDGSALEGFQPIEDSDLFLIPDAKTLDILPWRPSHGRVIRFFCEICSSAHQPYAMDCRTLLKHKMEELHEQGIQIMRMNRSELPCNRLITEVIWMCFLRIRERISVVRSASPWRRWESHQKVHIMSRDQDKMRLISVTKMHSPHAISL